MKFPDTSINALALLVLAGLATGLAGTVLEAILGEQTTPWAQVILLTAAFFIGFGVVYGPYALKSYRDGNSAATDSV